MQHSDAGAGVFVYRIFAAESMPLTNRENLTSFFKVKTAVFPHSLKKIVEYDGLRFSSTAGVVYFYPGLAVPK